MVHIAETEIARQLAKFITYRAHQERARRAAKTRARRTHTKIKRAAKQRLEGRSTGPWCLCGRELRDPVSIARGVGACCWAKIVAEMDALTAPPTNLEKEAGHAPAEHDQVANRGGQDESRRGDQTVVALPRLQRAPEQPKLDQDRDGEALRGQRDLFGLEPNQKREAQ